jgi:hypothetical protein
MSENGSNHYFQSRAEEIKEQLPFIYRHRQDHLDAMGCPLHPNTINNMDSRKEGCKEAVRIGRKIAYPILAFGRWLDEIAPIKKL